MTKPLVVIGGGEHARVVVEAARSRPDAWEVVGFTDPDPAAPPDLLGVPRLGGDEALDDLRAADAPALVLGVGTGAGTAVRAGIPGRLPGRAWAAVTHAEAIVSPSARIEPGAVVLARAVVNAGAVVGAHAIVNTGAIVEHDVVVGAFAHVAPGAVIGGGARVGQAAFIGLGALVRDHIDVGDGATVGMGAVVVGDVPAGATVVGVPARAVAAGADAVHGPDTGEPTHG